MTSVGIILLSLGVAAIVCLIAYFIYLHRLNRAVSKDGVPGEPRHRGVAPSDFVPWVLVVLLLIWNAISLSKILDQTQSLYTLSQELHFYYNELYAELDSLGVKAAEAAEAQNQLSKYSWQVGDVDYVAGTARLDFTFMPVEFTDNTRLTLIWGSRELKLSQRNVGSFTGSIYVDFFQDINESPALVLEEGEQKRVQPLRDVPQGSFWSLFLPYGQGYLDMDSLKFENNTLSLKGQLRLRLVAEREDIQIKEARLVKEVNGAVKKSETVKLERHSSIAVSFNDEFSNMSENDSFRMYLEVTNDAGYTVRTCVFDFVWDDIRESLIDSIQITDRNNKVIYYQKP